MSGIHICMTTAIPEEELNASTTYEQLKKLVLEAGRFSVFEATSSQHVAGLFERLCQDPEIETMDQGYPWTGVKRRGVLIWHTRCDRAIDEAPSREAAQQMIDDEWTGGVCTICGEGLSGPTQLRLEWKRRTAQ